MTHFLLKNNDDEYYVMNMDTLINENGSNPFGIFQSKIYDKNYNRIIEKDVYNVFYSDRPIQTTNRENIKDIFSDDNEFRFKI